AVSPRTRVVGVDARGSVVFGGPAAPRLLTGIGSSRRSSFLTAELVDEHRLVGDEAAFVFCRALYAATGIKVGGSSGAVMAGCADDTLLYLNRREVEQACAQLDPVAVVSRALALHSCGEAVVPDEAYLAWTNPHGEGARSLNMPGWVGGSTAVAGTKIINGNAANSARGLPRASGLTLLFDPTTARISCVLEAAYVSSLRTASVTALSAELFRGP